MPNDSNLPMTASPTLQGIAAIDATPNVSNNANCTTDGAIDDEARLFAKIDMTSAPALTPEPGCKGTSPKHLSPCPTPAAASAPRIHVRRQRWW